MAHITVPDEPTSTTFAVTTAQSVFSVPWTCFDKADIQIKVNGVALTQGDFTFVGNPGTEGGFDGATITLNTAVSSSTVVIYRSIIVKRTDDFGAGPVSSRDRNTALDRLTAMIQDRVAESNGLFAPVNFIVDADYSNLSAAASAAVATNRILYVTKGHAVDSDLTVACFVAVDGGSFTVAATKTLTFTRGLEAAPIQIFYGSGLVTGLRDVDPHWWGAKSDDTGDASVGWNKANACRMSAALTGTTVGVWRHRLNERGTYRFLSTAELHVSATVGLSMFGGGPIFQTILKAGSGSSGTILLKITAPLTGLDKIVTFDIGGFSVVEEAGTSMICGLQVGDTVTGSYGDKTYAIKGVTYSTISNVQSNGFTNGFKNVNASFIEYNNCTAWNQTSEAFVGFWDYCDRAGAVGFINYNNCYVAGNFGDNTRIGHLTDSASGGYATRIIGTIVMEDSGYQRYMKYAAGGSLANIEVGAASELDGDLDPGTSARGVYVECEDLLAYAGPASSCRNIIINGIWCAGHNDAAVTFKTVKTGSMRDIKILNSAIANHTGNAILIDGPIDGVMISNVSFQECSSAGPLVWLTNGVTKTVIDGVTLTQPTPALTVSSIVQIDSTCNNVSVENIIANEANCTAGLIVDSTPNTARKSIVSLTKGALVKPTGASVYSYDADYRARVTYAADFGFKADALLGSAAANKAALLAANATLTVGGQIVLPTGTAYIDPNITLGDYVQLSGVSRDASVLIATGTSADVLILGAGGSVSDVKITSTAIRSGGRMIYAPQNGSFVDRVSLLNQYIGIEFYSATMLDKSTARLEDFTIGVGSSAAGSGGILVTRFSDVQIRKGTIAGTSVGANQQTFGLKVTGTETLIMADLNFTETGEALNLTANTNSDVTAVYMVNCVFDRNKKTGGHSAVVYAVNTGRVGLVVSTNCWFGGADGIGLLVEDQTAGAGEVDGLVFVAPEFVLNGGIGCKINKAKRVQVIGGAAAANGSDGLFLEAVGGVIISAFTSGEWSYGVGNTGYGINLLGANDNYIVSNCDLRFNTLGPVASDGGDLPALTRNWDNNLGYVANSFGVGSFTTDASGDIFITHGLSASPRTASVQSQTPATPRLFIVDNARLTSTTFAVRVFTTGGVAVASTAIGTVSWEANI